MSEVDKPSDESAPSPDNVPQPSGASTGTGINRPRIGLFDMAKQTMEHIEKAERDKTIVLRHQDNRSTVFLFTGMILLMILVALIVTMPQMRGVCIALAIAADIFLALSIFWYVLLRFGTIRTLEPRHALLCWQLMLGSGILFAFYAMNVTLACFSLFANQAPPQ